MLKVSDNPAVLYPEDSGFEGSEGLWRVAHTKARNEKAFAWVLAKNEIQYFLPLREKVSVRGGRRLKSLLPLFSGYVFFCANEEQRHTALTSNRIAQVIEVIDQVGLKDELSQIHVALCSGLPVDPHPHLKNGDRCRVVGGPLRGAEGFVVRRKNVCQVVLQVSILGQAAGVEIDTDLVEPIQER